MSELVDAYLEHLRRAQCTEATLMFRRKLLDRIERELPAGLAVAGTEDLATWLYRDGWSRNTQSTYFAAIRSLYAWASRPRTGMLALDPTIDLEPVHGVRGVPRPVTDDQLRRILAESAEPIRTWARIAAYQGLRCCEISGLDREHVTEQQLIVVRGKGGRPRVHDTDPAVWEAVRDLPPGPIARMANGERATADQIGRRAAWYFRQKLGIDVTMHQFRHWLGVNVQRHYRDIRVTQKMLGHVSLASTQIYTDATTEQQREARAMLPRFDDRRDEQPLRGRQRAVAGGTR